MTPEEELIQRYFDAFNRHDIEGVMACFHEHPSLVGDGRRCEGRDAVRRQYEAEFAAFPDGRCDLRMCTGNSGNGVAESLFHGTRPQDGKVFEALGAEVMEIVDGKIKQIRDYHQRVPAKAA
jgi:ketosteroid isomerase-like protein